MFGFKHIGISGVGITVVAESVILLPVNIFLNTSVMF